MTGFIGMDAILAQKTLVVWYFEESTSYIDKGNTLCGGQLDHRNVVHFLPSVDKSDVPHPLQDVFGIKPSGYPCKIFIGLKWRQRKKYGPAAAGNEGIYYL